MTACDVRGKELTRLGTASTVIDRRDKAFILRRYGEAHGRLYGFMIPDLDDCLRGREDGARKMSCGQRAVLRKRHEIPCSIRSTP